MFLIIGNCSLVNTLWVVSSILDRKKKVPCPFLTFETSILLSIFCILYSVASMESSWRVPVCCVDIVTLHPPSGPAPALPIHADQGRMADATSWTKPPLWRPTPSLWGLQDTPVFPAAVLPCARVWLFSYVAIFFYGLWITNFEVSRVVRGAARRVFCDVMGERMVRILRVRADFWWDFFWQDSKIDRIIYMKNIFILKNRQLLELCVSNPHHSNWAVRPKNPL